MKYENRDRSISVKVSTGSAQIKKGHKNAALQKVPFARQLIRLFQS